MTEQVADVAREVGSRRLGDDRLETLGEQASAIDISKLFSVLLREKKRILLVALAFALVMAIITLLLPVQYSSVASFVPPTNSSNSGAAAALAGQLSSLGSASLLGGAVKTSGDLYAGILKSRSIAESLIEQFHLKQVYRVKRESAAIKKLGSNTAVVVGQKDQIITITVRDRSPQRAHDLANAYLDALQKTNGRLALTESSQRRLFFDQQLAKEKNDLEDAEVELKKVEEQSGMIAPTGQTALQIETIAQTRAQIADRQVQLAALRQSSTDQNPAIIRLRSEIEGLETQLARLQHGDKGNDLGNIPSSKVPAVQLMYVRKAREVKYHETLFDLIAKQDEAARMDEARDAPLLQVLDRASYPDEKSWPPRSLLTLGAFFLGGLTGCLWVLFREHKLSVGS